MTLINDDGSIDRLLDEKDTEIDRLTARVAELERDNFLTEMHLLGLLDECKKELEQVKLKRDEQEELRRIQIATICSASLQNTEKTVKQRITPDNPYWTVAYGDVCNAVDREMRERKALELACQYIYNESCKPKVKSKDEMIDYFRKLAKEG